MSTSSEGLSEALIEETVENCVGTRARNVRDQLGIRVELRALLQEEVSFLK